ncbi:MAG: helix-turn-helix domain-containing protein [Lachnospiraceae bacterium]|nr:helix-turn-helix domain-containing protein [Lachnospiraceae bacterium]
MKLYKTKNGKCNLAGAKIRLLRERAGLSQEQLAGVLQLAGLDLTQKTISRIETGERVIPDFELPYFADFFQTDISELLNSDL